MPFPRFLFGALCTLSISTWASAAPIRSYLSNPADSIESAVVQLIEEVKVEATRTNRSIANVPTRTEVLTDEIDEAASMEPSQIAHLITHSTGIQVQTTSATSNGAVVRIQGLNGRYTQMLKDGFPLYGGFSGSLDVMQIPPLDLRQVEYIKGSASTLYGGGAIGGLINLLTKKPTNEQLLHLNRSTIGAQDVNLFLSRREGKWGYTTLISRHVHSPYDADGDSFSDVPSVRKWAINPKLFFYPNERTEFWVGAQFQLEDRVGGDLSMLQGEAPTTAHFYVDSQNSQRVSTQALWRKTLTSGARITAKNALNQFDRELRIRPAFGLQDLHFAGRQRNSYTELNYAQASDQASLNVGVNLVTDQFEEFPLLSTPHVRNQQSQTLGSYVNHLVDLGSAWSLESGLRIDYAQAESAVSASNGEWFVLPRFNALYRASRHFTYRLGGGFGYRMPTLFNEEAEPLGYAGIAAIDFANLRAERSYGGNFDIKYVLPLPEGSGLLTLNQMFFYNLIDHAIQLVPTTDSTWSYGQSGSVIHSRGFETQLKLKVHAFTWFVGYTYTDAFTEDGSVKQAATLTPKHSIKGDLLYLVDGTWRIGWDYEYKSAQVLSSNWVTPELFSTGIIVERTFGPLVIFLNAENFTDVRQTRFGSLVSAPYQTPQYTEIWAPLDGYFFNAGLKYRF